MPLPRLNDTTKQLISLYLPSVLMSFGQSMVAPTVPLLAASFDVSASKRPPELRRQAD